MFPRGHKLPLCVTCAVTASGVRTNGAPGLSKRGIRARKKAREKELAEAAPVALPDIANPVPAGWAFADTEVLGATTASNAARPSSRRGSAAEQSRVEPGDMMSWLDSVYSAE